LVGLGIALEVILIVINCIISINSWCMLLLLMLVRIILLILL